MINFQPDICLPKDPVGFGMWLNQHYREHLQMRELCLLLNPPTKITDYDILSWRDEPAFAQAWLQTHESIHESLRVVCNVTGPDLSLVDFTKDDEFLDWMEDHAQEHQNFRTALGII